MASHLTNRDSLIFGTTKLRKDKTLADYNVQNGSTFLLLHNQKGSAQIFVETFTGKTITLKVECSDTVETIKTMIWDRESIPPHRQYLAFGTMILEDEMSLIEYDIPPESTLDLLHCFRGVMHLFVKTLKGNAIRLEIESSDTIAMVKGRVRDIEGIK